MIMQLKLSYLVFNHLVIHLIVESKIVILAISDKIFDRHCSTIILFLILVPVLHLVISYMMIHNHLVQDLSTYFLHLMIMIRSMNNMI